jgi:hypothetical protein
MTPIHAQAGSGCHAARACDDDAMHMRANDSALCAHHMKSTLALYFWGRKVGGIAHNQNSTFADLALGGSCSL